MDEQEAQTEMTRDCELVAAALAGGPEAFGPIVERYQDAVFGVALARLRDFHEAEDVAQNVFVEAFGRLGNLKDASRLGAWLRSITIHRSIDRIRRRRPAADAEARPMRASDEPTPPEQLARRELRDHVLAAIGRLSQTQRETTALFYVNGYSVAEVAGIQEVPVGTVKRRLHEAREKLKEEMIGMVEDVLKSEGPTEEFADKVFELLLQYERPRKWRETVESIRKLEGQGFEGFVRAFDVPHWQTRRFAGSLLKFTGQEGEGVVDLCKRALTDSNKKVRKLAMHLLHMPDISDERKREEFLPLLIPLLADPSRRVRWRAAFDLRHWAADIPLEPVVRALIAEKYERTRRAMEQLALKIMDARASD